MAFPENSPKHDPRFVPNRNSIESEEDEMLHNDPAERPLPGRALDAAGDSGDHDALIENATGQDDEAAGSEAASRSHDAEEDRVRPGDRKRGVE
jgi:hypothetical protein